MKIRSRGGEATRIKADKGLGIRMSYLGFPFLNGTGLGFRTVEMWDSEGSHKVYDIMIHPNMLKGAPFPKLYVP